MAQSSLFILFFTSIVSCTVSVAAKSGTSRTLRSSSAEQSYQSAATDEASVQIPTAVTEASSSEIKLMSSMGALMQSEDQAMDPESLKAKLQRKLVALIWLEKVLQQNIDSMDESSYSAKIGQSKASLAQETTPATAEMLSKMRMEMHEFAVPFYQTAMGDELKRIRRRQKGLLDKLIALDAGEQVSDIDEEPAALEEQEDDKPEGDEKASPAPKLDKKKKQMTAEETKARAARRAQSSNFILIMSLLAGLLVFIVCGVAIKVATHVRST